MGPKSGKRNPEGAQLVFFCSLKQALYWIAFGIEPVPEKHLEALERPDLSDQSRARNDLVLALRQERITAYGVPSEYDYSDEGREAVSHRCGPECPPTIAPIPSDYWSIKASDFDRNLLDIAPGYEEDDTGYPNLVHSEVSATYSLYPAECFFRHVHLAVQELKSAFPPKVKTERRGAPPKFRCDELYLHLFGVIWGDGWSLDDKKRLVDEAMNWAAVNWGDDAPTDRQIHTKVTQLVAHLKQCEKPDRRR